MKVATKEQKMKGFWVEKEAKESVRGEELIRRKAYCCYLFICLPLYAYQLIYLRIHLLHLDITVVIYISGGCWDGNEEQADKDTRYYIFKSPLVYAWLCPPWRVKAHSLSSIIKQESCCFLIPRPLWVSER